MQLTRFCDPRISPIPPEISQPRVPAFTRSLATAGLANIPPMRGAASAAVNVLPDRIMTEPPLAKSGQSQFIAMQRSASVHINSFRQARVPSNIEASAAITDYVQLSNRTSDASQSQ